MSQLDAYVKAALFGLAIYLAAVLIILVAILVISPSDIAFPIIFGVPALIAVAALRFLRRWGLLIAGLLSLVGIVFLLGGAGLSLTTPEAFFDFVLHLFGLTGLIISLVACVVGFVQYFRGAVPSEVWPSIAMTLRGIAAVVAVLALVSIVLTVLNATDNLSAEERGTATLAVSAEDTKWNVEQLEAPAGEPIRILVVNDDPILHTFTIEDDAKGVDVDVKLGPWSEQIVEIDALEPGIYGYICRVEGHEEDMTGALTVE
jgi:plastocyanin